MDSEVEFVSKPDVNLKICKRCGYVVSIQYKDFEPTQ
jgi:ribosomal protein L40E